MVLDTNILVAYLKGEPEVVAALEQWRQEGRGLVVSCISFAEVLALPPLTGSEIQVVLGFCGASSASRLTSGWRRRLPG